VSSRKGSCQITRFASVTEGVANQSDWRETVVVDPMWETELLPGWVIEIFPGDYGLW
jgi:hypothetical protein